MPFIDKEEALRIPILEVAALVVTDFGMHNHILTGRCCNHTDNKFGNFSFGKAEKQNICYCFTCHHGFNTITLVQGYLGLSFIDSLKWLYDHFPTYFTNTASSYTAKKDIDPGYKALGFSNYINYGEKLISIDEAINKLGKEIISEKAKMKLTKAEALWMSLSPTEKEKRRYEYEILVKGITATEKRLTK
ncbi:MAG: hypothetical protein J5992_03750 [Oscillospiraceae bacterium]|nr:hypothetical protein [Oscillospiraceae bacterium]